MFFRQVRTLVGGNGLAQAVTILCSPILSRLYAPQDFGWVALYVAIVIFLSPLVTERYEYAILLPRSARQAFALVKISAAIIGIVMLLTLCMCAVIFAWKPTWLAARHLDPWLWGLPISLGLVGCYQIAMAWLNRQQQYRNLATATVTQAFTNSSAALVLGSMSVSSGLFWGQLCCRLPYAYLLARVWWPMRHWRYLPRYYYVLLRRYRNFPCYSVLTGVLYSVSQQLPILFLSCAYGGTVTGWFALGMRVLLFTRWYFRQCNWSGVFQNHCPASTNRGYSRHSAINDQSFLALIAGV